MASLKTTVKVEGLKELEDNMKVLSKATQGNVLKRAATAAAADYADLAISMAPQKSGMLKKEIKVAKAKIISPGKAAFAAAMSEGSTRAEASSAARAANKAAGGEGRSAVTHAGPTRAAFWGVFQEFGTRKMSPKPFMRPAWDASRTSMLDTIKETLREEIDKAVARMERKALRNKV